MRRCCALCGNIDSEKAMKRMCTGSKNTNLIMVASLSLVGIVDRANAEAVVEEISRNSKYICYSHVMQAAQYLCAEMAARGRRLSFYKSEAYVTSEDIPADFVDVINSINNSNTTITARDVRSFVNCMLKRYHASSLWPDHYTEDEMGVKLPAPEAGDSTARSEPDVKVEVDSGNDVDMTERPGGNDVEASTFETKVFENVPATSDLEGNSVLVSQEVGMTHATDLQKYYLVKGEMLMKLFRFCPECGKRLGRAQLKSVGTAAVVRFVCESCSVRPVGVKNWESQGRAGSTKRVQY